MRRPYDAIIWWERRRIPYNAIVIAIAALSFGIIEGIGARLVQPGEDVVEPLALIFLAAPSSPARTSAIRSDGSPS